jgi:hypothetical protein
MTCPRQINRLFILILNLDDCFLARFLVSGHQGSSKQLFRFPAQYPSIHGFGFKGNELDRLLLRVHIPVPHMDSV